MKSSSGHHQCPVCNSGEMTPFFELRAVPVLCNVLWESPSDAKNCERGDIQLACCSTCGLIRNLDFDHGRTTYGVEYENSLHYSPRFQAYAKALAERMIEKFSLHDKNIIEIGCGKGDFLLMLCREGKNKGLGFDKSYVKRAEHANVENVRFIQDFYSDKYADEPADLICCRQVLEHMHDPVSFLRDIRRIIEKHETVNLFFEVPNGLHTFERMAVWDIIYEHPVYFTPPSLANAFELSGFAAKDICPQFDDQFLSITAELTSHENTASDILAVRKDEVSHVGKTVRAFSARFDEVRNKWRSDLDTMKREGKTAAIWGCGSKGISFLNIMDCSDIVTVAVDINPRKQGKFVTGTGQEIISPDTLAVRSPDVIIVMNPSYVSEIRQTVSDIGIAPELMVM